MLVLDINKERPQTVFRQIVDQIINLVTTGILFTGYKMPSTRELADKLGVNRTTVVRAYEELWSLGYIESSPGSYTYVRERKRIIKTNETNNFDEELISSLFVSSKEIDFKTIRGFRNNIKNGNQQFIDFQRLEPDSRLLDRKLWSNFFRNSLYDNSFDVFGYSNPRGYVPLLNDIVNHMRLHCINVSEENILITNGSQNSLHLIFQTYLSKNDVVVVESPTYSMLIPLLRYYGVKVLEVPVIDDGMDLTCFKKVIKTTKVKMVYTMPTFHNPTGITMSQKKREVLLSICEREGIIIVEDSIEEEMKYYGKVHLPIKSMDRKGIVIYLGSFSKIVSPGLRIAWVVANQHCIDQLTTVKTTFDLSTNTISQVLLHHFLSSGNYEIYIRKVMRVFKNRMNTALKYLKQNMPMEKVSWKEPLGGYLLWLKLNTKKRDINFEDYFRNYNVLISNGSSFFYSPGDDFYIRISISKSNEEEIKRGLNSLARGIECLD